MTDSVHPTPGELADLHAGQLSGAARARLRGHVEQCDACTAELAAIDEVGATLAATGNESLTMPTDVAADIDAALAVASAERAAQIPSLAAKRDERAQRRRTPWVLIGGAAAATVVVLGSIGLSGLDGMQSSNDDSAGGAAESSAADQQIEGDERSAAPDKDDAGAGGDTAYSGQPVVTPESLPAFAGKLSKAMADGKPLRTVVQRCLGAVPQSASARSARAGVLWQGEPAVVVVEPADRTVAVFGCGTGSEPLYSTSY